MVDLRDVARRARVHPAESDEGRVHAGHKMLGAHLYLMCDDLQAS